MSPTAMSHHLRTYSSSELGKDGYPIRWHKAANGIPAIKDLVRMAAGFRCVRCGHPYRNGEYGTGEWSPCDERCTHGGPVRDEFREVYSEPIIAIFKPTLWEAQWRILTVHHLDGAKANCHWWNLAALCQRCHLTTQGRVRMERVWPWEHSDWFKPYVAGFYAWSYLGEELDRVETEGRLDELLALERLA